MVLSYGKTRVKSIIFPFIRKYLHEDEVEDDKLEAAEKPKRHREAPRLEDPELQEKQ